MNEFVYVVFAMGSEDPLAICANAETAYKILEEDGREDGVEIWVSKWELEDYK